MIRRTMLFTMREDASAAAVADLESLTRAAVGEIEGVTRIEVGRNEAPGPWSHVWDMDVADVETVRRYGPSPYHMDVLVPIFNPASDKALVSKLDYLWYEAIASAAEGVDDPIRRVMFFQMDESATEAQTAELEEMLQELGGRIDGLPNWALSRRLAEGNRSGWTHCWETEFGGPAGLDAYSKDSFHRETVTPYFLDPEKKIVSAVALAIYRPGSALITA